MEKFLIHKRPRSSIDDSSVSSNSSPSVQLQVPPNSNVNVEFNPNDVVSDPGLCKKIEEFDVNIRDRVRREYISRGPCRPIGHTFPRRLFGISHRNFRVDWYKEFDWLEYSISKDAAYCFPCYLFKPTNVSRFGDEVFTIKGFNNWKKGLEKLRGHIGVVNGAHHDATNNFEAFKNQRQSVSHALSNQSREVQEHYHVRLTTTLDVIRYLLRKGLSFRGHDESLTSLNKGNFLQLLEWYTSKNKDIAKVVGINAPQNNLMTSPAIQKELTNACAVETTLVILNDIGEKCFTILVDESRDSSVKEQMAVFLRYVNTFGEVVERLLGVVHVKETSAECLKDSIDALFTKHGLSLSKLRGQDYDGASNMRGKFKGLKTLILRENPHAFYVHCFANQLQLVIVAVAKGSNQIVGDLFTLVSMIVNMSGASCKRADNLQQLEHDRIIKHLESGEITSGTGLNQETGLARPGDTRWGSHYTTLLHLHLMWPSVLSVLENVYDDGDDKGISRTLLIRMESYDFVFLLHLMKQILAYTNDLSNLLQKRDQNIVQAMHLIKNVKGQLLDLRDRRWETFLLEVDSFCVAHNIQVVNMDDIAPRRTRMKRDGTNVTYFQHYRYEVYHEVLDKIGLELHDRFPELTTDLLLSVACLDPRDLYSKFDVNKLVHLAGIYSEDFSWTEVMMIKSQLEMYIYDVKRDVNFSANEDLGCLAKKMIATGKAHTFPLVYRLIELALLLPVATASVERTFSAMNIVKTDLRNQMSDDWLNDCLVVFSSKDIFINIDNEDILDRFQMMSDRRYQLPPRNRRSNYL